MKRFFCTVCKKVKRVRKFPTRIQNEYATYAEERQGECNRHYLPASARQSQSRRQKVGA